MQHGDAHNPSIQDEATAAAEIYFMCVRLHRYKRKKFFVSDRVHPHTIDVLKVKSVEEIWVDGWMDGCGFGSHI